MAKYYPHWSLRLLFTFQSALFAQKAVGVPQPQEPSAGHVQSAHTHSLNDDLYWDAQLSTLFEGASADDVLMGLCLTSEKLKEHRNSFAPSAPPAFLTDKAITLLGTLPETIRLRWVQAILKNEKSKLQFLILDPYFLRGIRPITFKLIRESIVLLNDGLTHLLCRLKTHEITPLLENPSLIFKQAYGNINAQPTAPCGQPKIPCTLQLVWLARTNEAPLRDEDIQQALENQRILLAQSNCQGEPVPWEFVLWVNDESKIPNLHELEKHGFQIRNLHDPQYELSPEYIAQVDALVKENRKGYNLFIGIAVNIARFIILEKHGGFYADINFRLNPEIDWTALAHTFNFLSPARDQYSAELLLGPRPSIFMFAASPGHPIFQEIISALFEKGGKEHRFGGENPQPLHLLNASKPLCTLPYGIGSPGGFSGHQLVHAFSSHANQLGYIDVLFPDTRSATTAQAIRALLEQHKRTLLNPIHASTEDRIFLEKTFSSLLEYLTACPEGMNCNLGEDGPNGRTWR